MKRTISVTQEDIKTGHACSDSTCPIALAIFRRFPKAHSVSVQYTFAYVERSRRSYLKARLPVCAIDFLYAFDKLTPESAEIVPFKFDLRFSEV